jgi:hypothetical protein
MRRPGIISLPIGEQILGKDGVSRIHPLRQIFSIYMHRSYQKSNEQLTKEYPQVTSDFSSTFFMMILPII